MIDEKNIYIENEYRKYNKLMRYNNKNINSIYYILYRTIETFYRILSQEVLLIISLV